MAPMSIPLAFEAVGTVRSETSAVLSSKMMGQVIGVHFREGDTVRQGQLLVELDSREVAAQVQQARAGQKEVDSALEEVEQGIIAAEAGRDAAQANADLASATYRRYQSLLQRNSVSQQEFDQVEAQHKAAASELRRAESMLLATQPKKSQVRARQQQVEAGLSQAEVFLSYAKIRAPFSGVTTEKKVDLGDMAAPGMPLVTLEDNRRYRLEATVPESHWPRVSVGQKVAVQLEALGTEVDGTVAEVAVQLDAGSRSAVVKIDLPRQEQLRSGMFGRARFRFGERTVMSIPEGALVERGQLSGVFVLDAQNRARFRLLKLGKPFGNRIEVLAGLSEKDRVISQISPALRDGSSVQAISNP
jgi:multidrug efflux pump subunit AcrA (membrane-fusion protein)